MVAIGIAPQADQFSPEGECPVYTVPAVAKNQDVVAPSAPVLIDVDP